MAGMDIFASRMAEGIVEDGKCQWLKGWQRRLSTILNNPNLHIAVTCLAIADATFLVCQLIIDLIIVREMFRTNVDHTKTISFTLNDTYYPDFACFGGDHYDTGSVEDLVSFLNYDDHSDGNHGNGHHRKRRDDGTEVQDNRLLSPIFAANRNLPFELHLQQFCAGIAIPAQNDSETPTDVPINKIRRSARRAADNDNDVEHPSFEYNNTDKQRSNHETGHGNELCPNVTTHKKENHYVLLQTVSNIFGFGSLVPLTIMVVEKMVRLFAFGKTFFKNKLQVFDTVVLLLIWVLDSVLLDGIWARSMVDSALTLIVILPWRVIRIVNCFVMTFKQRYKIRIRLLEEKTDVAEKNAGESVSKMLTIQKEIKLLQDLAKIRGASQEDITKCNESANDSLRRKKGMYLKSLSEITSLLGSTVASPLNTEVLEDKIDEEVKLEDGGTSANAYRFVLPQKGEGGTTVKSDAGESFNEMCQLIEHTAEI
ncbi:unnamed protein product [Owenia fusiformis]|uniref:Uncharacterized protein n=1 Tax=Owenia fusiformis TaxID=6347 RepID=A0A8J1UER2_OWEFU|nr:unnamed protein product [Owenia fusiformis]